MSALQARLGERGQYLAIDAPLPHRATVGGTLATGIGGPARWHNGAPRDTVIGMTIAQPDGRITHTGGRVVKNVSGYDMARLHVGGLGTLGVIAEASFKLTPLPVRGATVLANFDSVREALGAALGVFSSGVMPLALTVFDASTAERMGQTLPQADSYLAIMLGGRPLTLGQARPGVPGRNAAVTRPGPSKSSTIPSRTAFGRGLTDFGYERRDQAAGRRTSPRSAVERARAR